MSTTVSGTKVRKNSEFVIECVIGSKTTIPYDINAINVFIVLLFLAMRSVSHKRISSERISWNLL